jgi:hypothetical protein
MKNQMLNNISKATFLRLVVEGTNTFKALYENGTPIKAAAVAADVDLSGIKRSMRDAGVCSDLSTAMIDVLSAAIAKSKKAEASTRRPTAEELNKQFLSFVPYAAVVPLRNRNHHKYTIGEPVIMMIGTPGTCTGMYGMDKYGCIHVFGDELPRLRKSLRPATFKELSWLVDTLYY